MHAQTHPWSKGKLLKHCFKASSLGELGSAQVQKCISRLMDRLAGRVLLFVGDSTIRYYLQLTYSTYLSRLGLGVRRATPLAQALAEQRQLAPACLRGII